MTQDDQSRAIAEQAERLIAEAEESGKRWRAKLAALDIQPEEYGAAYSQVRPGVIEVTAQCARDWVQEEFPAPKAEAAPRPMRRTMV